MSATSNHSKSDQDSATWQPPAAGYRCTYAEPTAGIIDAQSVRAAATVPAASRGWDGGKKVPGRKRHIVTDTLGLLLAACVTAADIGDREPRRAC